MNDKQGCFMGAALSFVDKDYLDRQPTAKAPVVPDRGFAERLVAEADDMQALLLLLGRTDPEKQWTRPDITALLAGMLVKLDRLLNDQINAILHHPDFQALEANWRGLQLLSDQVVESDSEGLVKVRFLDLSWNQLRKDLTRSIEFDHSRLFAKIYSEEFGNPGGEPFGLLLGAYTVSHRTEGGQSNMDTLKELARVGAAAFAPVIVNADPSFFGVDQFADLTAVSELESHFSQPELVKWQSLRQEEDSRFLGLAMPRIMLRAPHLGPGQGVEGFRFRESGSQTATDYLWGPACFGFGTVAIRAFCESGWFAQIRGFRAGQVAHGVVDNLPSIQTNTRTGVLFPSRHAVDWQITDRMERALADEGFLPLSPLANTEMLAFHSVPSVQQPATYEKPSAEMSARLSAMLHYTLCVSRFAHYLKVMGRDRVGGYRTPEDCEEQLRKWLRGYTMATEGASDEMRARFPLRDAHVSVKARAGDPGKFYSVIRLQPHFQIDQLVTGMKLITELTPVNRI
ncbi:type VI secretion system contractile sheath large subunit [Marinobacter sp. LN3S78]|uniref:type VI secretion system contractile sheath large subunit n=1 Tax=Marinobacter sp. LN3S78 TaxID=3382300 RepID=UPI00387AF57C